MADDTKQTDPAIIIGIHGICNLLKSTLKRQKEMKDPVVRYSMMVDELAMTVDLATATLETYLFKTGKEEDEFTKSTKNNLQEVVKDLNGELESLLNWIQSPHMSPDHPMGNSFMHEFKRQFDDSKDQKQ